MVNTETKFDIRYTEEGRSGTIHIKNDVVQFDFWYELAMPPALVIIGIPEPKYWEAQTKTSLTDREKILDVIAELVIRDKLSGVGYHIIDDNILSICPGSR